MIRPKVALIDDDLVQLELNRVVFSKVLPNVEMISCHHQAGQGLALDSDVDLILIDYLLQGMTASALIPALREQLVTDVPIVVVSNATSAAVEREVLGAGACALFEKPFNMAEVKALASRLADVCPKLIA